MSFGDLEGLSLKSIHQDLFRNIVSLRETQDLYDDLSENPEDWQAAIELEATHKRLDATQKRPEWPGNETTKRRVPFFSPEPPRVLFRPVLRA